MLTDFTVALAFFCLIFRMRDKRYDEVSMRTKRCRCQRRASRSELRNVTNVGASLAKSVACVGSNLSVTHQTRV